MGRNPSYVWKSITATRDIIDKGLRWNLGNDKKVNIWNDRWLPTADTFRIVSPRNQEVRLEKVEQLIDFERGYWNIEKVRHTFMHHEVETILGIPLSSDMIEDSQSWAWTKNGKQSMLVEIAMLLLIC